MILLHLLLQSLYLALGMFWEIFWALILGFALSGVVMTFVSKEKMVKLLGRPGFKELGLAALFGASSSSCSYAAASMTKSIYQKGADIIPALAFMLASTNLVLELSVILWVLMGWQFVLGEFVGGLVMIAIMSVLMKAFGPLRAFDERREALNKEDKPSCESDAEEERYRFFRLEGWRAVARSFVSEWRMIGKDIAIGMFVSGFLMAFVPDSFWAKLFLRNGPGALEDHSTLKLIENVLVGPLVSMISFVCSVGNIPLAHALYRGGIGFGGALSFIYADLIIIPLILVYRKYYGWRLALWITGIFYTSMVLSGILMDFAFTALHLLPSSPSGMAPMDAESPFFKFNYTFWLNLFFAGIAIVLVILARSGPDEGPDSCCH
jgi:uncharacterized membrane protein YraQ (UPF0718 family)